MPSTSRHTSARAPRALFLIAMATVATASGLSQMTYEGCYSSSQPLKDQGSYTYQTSGYCQPICVKQNQPVLALSGGSNCWCGGLIPAADTKVDDSKCNTPCNGYSSQMCGGNGYYTVYLTGIDGSVGNYGGSSGSGTHGGSPSQTTVKPTVVTKVSPGTTIVVTSTPSAAAGSSSSSSSGSGGTNVAGIAAGVVVGVVLAAAAVAGVFFWLRYRRRKVAEDEYKRSTQVADFMRKPPQTGYSSTSDARLDPEAGNRRNSVGSIADDQDFSRKILRVANPDRGQ